MMVDRGVVRVVDGGGMRRYLGVVAMLIAAVVVCGAHAGQKNGFANPLIAADFPDPAVLRDVDGTWYAYATNGGAAHAHIQVASSRDLTHWKLLGEALPVKPGWADQRHKFWAPDVHRFGDLFVMYFAAEPNDSVEGAARMCIGTATAKVAAGPFVDTGAPLLCGAGFGVLDPAEFDDPQTGKKLMYWGSDFQPLKVQELADDRLHFKAGTEATVVMRPVAGDGADNYRKLVEGSWVTFHKGWYYLYFSGDNCCGAGAHYAVMVARSRSAMGPFEGVRVILSASGRWLAPGHNSVAVDDKGHEWMLYHAIDPSRRGEGRFLMMDRIVYRDGWPQINDGKPSDGVVVGPWIRR
jgi:arabinan endo-1,5-alpha-L-arabinosidase